MFQLPSRVEVEDGKSVDRRWMRGDERAQRSGTWSRVVSRARSVDASAGDPIEEVPKAKAAAMATAAVAEEGGARDEASSERS